MFDSKSLSQVHTHKPGENIARHFRVRVLALPTIVALVGLYIVLHSPLRDAIASLLGFKAGGCFLRVDALTLNHIFASFAGLILIVLALITSWIVTQQINCADYEKSLVFGLVALAVVVVPAAMIGSFADRVGMTLLKPPLGPLLSTLPSAIVSAIFIGCGWRPRPVVLRLTRPSNLVFVVGGVAIATLTTSLTLSVMHPPTSGDALSYHAPLAAFLWRDGNLGTFLDRAPGVWALAHPGNAELWFGLLQIIGGEPLANLGQFPFALLGSVAIYAFARRMKMPHNAALLSAFAFLLVPMVVLQSGMQPNDVIGAALVMMTIALASAPISDWNFSRLASIGIGLGLSATTKLALLPYVGAIGIFVIGALLRKRVSMRAVVTQSMLVAICFLIVVAPWWSRNVVRYGNPLYPAALPLIGRGFVFSDFAAVDTAFVPSRIAWPLYPALEPHDDRSGFGGLLLVGALPGFFFALARRRRQPLLVFLLSAMVMLPAWWIMTLRQPRFLLAIAGLAFAFLPWTLLAIPHARRKIGLLLIAVAAFFSAMVTFDQALLPFARQPNTRVEFYDRVWGLDPAVITLPESEGLFLNTGFAPSIFEYTSYYPLLGESNSRTVIPMDSDVTTELIVARMQSAGVQYAYVTASPDNRPQVESIYDPAHFELVHRSTIVVGESSGARRNLYRLATSEEEPNGTRRYLYRLR